MKCKNIILAMTFILVMSGCIAKENALYPVQNNSEYAVYGQNNNFMPEQCAEETVVIYDDDGQFEVPGCRDFVIEDIPAQNYVNCADSGDCEEDVDPDSIEGDFPYVRNNKYLNNNLILLQNLEKRTLAFCRGTAEQAENCAQRLEKSCFVRVRNIPSVAAKYDRVQQGAFPGRRWHKGDVVPRW